MKIRSIKAKETRETVYDIETPCHNYILANNSIISHNTMNQYDPYAIPGGNGLYFACSSIVLATSKAKAKATQSDTDVIGASILAHTRKSRFCKEHSKLRYMIKYDGGIHPYFGILDDALEGGYVDKPTVGYYSRPCVDGDKKWRERELWENSPEFWAPILRGTDFSTYIEAKYTFLHSEITDEDFDIAESGEFHIATEAELNIAKKKVKSLEE